MTNLLTKLLNFIGKAELKSPDIYSYSSTQSYDFQEFSSDNIHEIVSNLPEAINAEIGLYYRGV